LKEADVGVPGFEVFPETTGAGGETALAKEAVDFLFLSEISS
jgi:hypothetical protein